MDYEEYISEIDGKFSIDRIFNDKQYNFGVFDNYDDALEKLEYLDNEGWPISIEEVEKDSVTDKFGGSLDNIEKVDEHYLVFKYIGNDKVVFGEFETVEEAEQIRDNLIANAWESTEVNSRSKYVKYITKSGGKFVVSRIYNGKPHYFGYFNTFDEALSCRENLIANNWGELNISLQMKPGKYISYNGIMYTINRNVDGTMNVYGFFNELEDAIKQRDWLVAHNWSRLEVPDDSKRHIHKKGDKFLIYKRLKDDIEYFGTFDSLDEAKQARNKLVENDWVLDDFNDVEKISDFVYFDGEFYTIEKDVDGQIRIYGVYKNKKQALSDEKSFKSYDWDAPYAVPTDEYPYGNHIVPFDYIFNLEKMINGVSTKIGTYYSFNEALIARNNMFGEDKPVKNKLTFSVKVGKSYKNRGWSIIRDTTYDLIPKLDYEDECDIIVDGIPTTAKLNLLPRIFYTKTDEVVNHLKELAEINPDDRIDVQLLLNKDAISNDYESEMNSLNENLRELNEENSNLKDDVRELKEILEYIDAENSKYYKKFDDLNRIMEKFNQINLNNNDILSLSDANLRIKLMDVIKLINSLKKL